jgi:putative transposase
MMRHSKLSDAIGNLGFYEFRRQLTYKQDFYGTVVELVDRWYPSSKTCSDCGHVQQMTLRDRTFTCKGCGVVKCRDFNASVNLENAPNAQVRRATAELNACGEQGADSPRGSRKQTSKRKS